MEFQVLSVVLEDRYPKALPTGVTREDILEDGFCDDVNGEFVRKRCNGCVAFVFGRAEDGRSVCVRVEGVRPCLYYALKPGELPGQLRRELKAEVSSKLREWDDIAVTLKKYTHFYDFEPDPTTASGRHIHDYVEARYTSLAAWREAKKLRREDESGNPPAHVRPAHEGQVDPTMQFLQEAGIKPGGWVRADVEPVDQRVSSCDVEAESKLAGFTALPEKVLDAPYVSCYYDIETIGLDPEDGTLIQVSLVFSARGKAVEKHVVALGTVDPVEGVHVHSVHNEADVIRKTRHILMEKDPDWLVTYNGTSFDNNFLAVRASANHAEADAVAEFLYLGRFALRPTRFREQKLSSDGMGDNVLQYFDTPGRCNLDFLVILRREHTSEVSYKLDHFAAKFCGDEKEAMDYREIPKLQAGTAADRARLASYCAHDSHLLKLIDEAQNITAGIVQYSQIYGVLPEWVYFRGQQVRYVAQLRAKVRTAEADPMIANVPVRGLSGKGAKKFQGATVNEPKRGFYKRPVATLDWKSLYPSVMLAHNLCPSTLVRDPALFDMEGVVAHPVRPDHTTHFTTKQPGILPLIIRELLDSRSHAKKQIKLHTKLAKEAGTDDERARQYAIAKVWDGRQLAIKISVNSVYGIMGACGVGENYCMDVSETVTYRGRDAMVIKKEILPQRFPGIDIIYGDTDSVMVVFPEVAEDGEAADAEAEDLAKVQECGDLAEEAATFVTDEFARRGWPDMVLEFEKVFLPYLLFKKKRYIGLKYEPDGDNVMHLKGIDSKGVETERKDTLPFLKAAYMEARDALVYKVDAQLALRTVQDNLARLVRGEVPFEQFIMSKSLKAHYKDPDSQVQVRVNQLRAQREPGSEEAVNGRVDYVIVNGHKKGKATDLAEDPRYAREHGLPLNYLWYFEHRFRDPMYGLFAVVDEVSLDETFAHCSAQLDRARLGLSDVLQKALQAPSGGAGSSAGRGGIVVKGSVYVPTQPKRRKRK